MVSSASSLPWSVVPARAREFPAKVWLATRWPFYVPPLFFAHQIVKTRPAGWEQTQRRAFPAQVWLAAGAERREQRSA